MMPSTNIASGAVTERDDMRSAIGLAAKLHVDDRAILPATVINLSRHGVQIAIYRTLKVGEVVCLEAEGWPKLMSRVIWSQSGRAGCMFTAPPCQKAFKLMLAERAHNLTCTISGRISG